MKLFLVRHGEYEVSDIKAPLNAKGKRDIQKLSQFLKNAMIEVTTILHSDKLRAKQTAEILALSVLNDKHALQYRPGLSPLDDVGECAKEIALYSDDAQLDLMIVSHMPFLSRLVSQLVIRDANKEIMIFDPGTLVCLEHHPQEPWQVKWVISPDLLT